MLDLTQIGPEHIHLTSYRPEDQSEALLNMRSEFFLPAEKFWFFVPEYNGSIPGILKMLLDALSIDQSKESFSEKKACITGTATGRAGNLRGIDHLSDILNNLNVTVFPSRLPISSIHKLIDEERNLIHLETINCLQKQADQFVAY